MQFVVSQAGSCSRVCRWQSTPQKRKPSSQPMRANNGQDVISSGEPLHDRSDLDIRLRWSRICRTCPPRPAKPRNLRE